MNSPVWRYHFSEQRDFRIHRKDAGILLIAGGVDEAWASEYSVSYMEKYLKEKNCGKD